MGNCDPILMKFDTQTKKNMLGSKVRKAGMIDHFQPIDRPCMNDLTGTKVLKGERMLFNAFKDIYFTSKMKFENSLLNQAFKKETCCQKLPAHQGHQLA
jgi:hypothetical protein